MFLLTTRPYESLLPHGSQFRLPQLLVLLHARLLFLLLGGRFQHAGVGVDLLLSRGSRSQCRLNVDKAVGHLVGLAGGGNFERRSGVARALDHVFDAKGGAVDQSNRDGLAAGTGKVDAVDGAGGIAKDNVEFGRRDHWEAGSRRGVYSGCGYYFGWCDDSRGGEKEGGGRPIEKGASTIAAIACVQ